jgi:cytochrome d ubiquinol oxidase subunit II
MTMPDLFYVILFPVLAFFAFGMYLHQLHKRSEFKPFLWNVIMVFCSFVGLSVGFYPYIIPNMVTIKGAAVSSPQTLIFMLAAMVILLPLILAYVGYNHWIFRGKVESGSIS